MADAESALCIARAAHWVRIEINRPLQSNAANHALWRELGDTVERLAREEGVSALIVTGTGEKVFMAGADLAEMPSFLADEERLEVYLAAISRAFDVVEATPVPVIAAINGAAMGGGLELAIACDYRLAVPHARLGIPSADLGIGIDYPDVERLVALVGTSRAREILIFGRIYGAEEALAIDLVNEVVPPADLMARAEELAELVALKAPLSVQSAKSVLRALVHQGGSGTTAQRAEALGAIRATWRSADLRARVGEYLERRQRRSGEWSR